VPWPVPRTNKWLVTVSVTFGTLKGTLDASIVNVALPHMRGTVGPTLEEITWITSGFVIANVTVMPLTGFMGRRFGQKRVSLLALAVFIGGSAPCGTAHSLFFINTWAHFTESGSDLEQAFAALGRQERLLRLERGTTGEL